MHRRWSPSFSLPIKSIARGLCVERSGSRLVHDVRVRAVERRREDAAPEEVRAGEQRRERERGREHEEEAEERAVEHQLHELPLLARSPTRLVRRHLLI